MKLKLNDVQARGKRGIFFVPYVIAGLILIILPHFLPRYAQSMMSAALIYAIFAMSLNLLMGYTGLLSFGHAASFGVAGYTVGILITRYGIKSFWMAAPLGVLMATLTASILGIIALRTSGIYFLLVTFGLGQLLSTVAWKWGAMTGGENGLSGIPLPDLGFFWLTWNTIYFYFFVLVAFLICSFLLYQIVNSPFGYALQGIRDNERRMRNLGYNTWLYKYISFIIGGLFAGIAGVYYAHYSGIIAPLHLGLLTSAAAMLMVSLGGARVFFGPAIGAVVITLLEYFASLYAPARWPLILGCIFVLSVIFLRGGISIYLVKTWNMMKYHGSVEG